MGDVWTAERIAAQGVQMLAVDAVRAVYGVGETTARATLRSDEQRGQLGFRVLRLGRRYVAPTAEVLRVLGLPTAV